MLPNHEMSLLVYYTYLGCYTLHMTDFVFFSKVRWKGYSHNDDTWESIEGLRYVQFNILQQEVASFCGQQLFSFILIFYLTISVIVRK